MHALRDLCLSLYFGEALEEFRFPYDLPQALSLALPLYGEEVLKFNDLIDSYFEISMFILV